MKIAPYLKKSIYSALTFFGTLIVLSVAYAAYQTITAWEYASGQTLSSALMGKIIGNIDDLNTRINGITTSSGQIRPEVLPFRKGQIVGSGSVILTGATANSDTGYYQVEELEANRNLISTSVHWGIGKSQIGTMVSGNPTWRYTVKSSMTSCSTVCSAYGGTVNTRTGASSYTALPLCATTYDYFVWAYGNENPTSTWCGWAVSGWSYVMYNDSNAQLLGFSCLCKN